MKTFRFEDQAMGDVLKFEREIKEPDAAAMLRELVAA
jgi:hypothetical protein